MMKFIVSTERHVVVACCAKKKSNKPKFFDEIQQIGWQTKKLNKKANETKRIKTLEMKKPTKKEPVVVRNGSDTNHNKRYVVLITRTRFSHTIYIVFDHRRRILTHTQKSHNQNNSVKQITGFLLWDIFFCSPI